MSTTVAPGGLGKSSLALAEGVAIASGHDLLGIIPKESVRVWIWNGEDPAEETERRIAALCHHHEISPDELTGRLFIDSGRTMPIKIAAMSGAKVAVASESVDAICATIEANKIGVLIIDPFISCHGVPENDNGAIDAVAKVWAQIADRCNISIELVHHVRKPAQGQHELTIDDARGGSALVNAARSGRVLNRMSTAEAAQASIDDRRSYFRADSGKANLAPASRATWFHLVPVMLPNGDSVAAVTSWAMPGAMDKVTTAHMQQIRSKVRDTEYRKDSRSPDWVGTAVAALLGLDPDAAKPKLKEILKVWFSNGVLATERRRDNATRKDREFVVPGDWNEGGGSHATV